MYLQAAYDVIGPKGEVLKYVLQNEGTSSNPNWRLFQWNSSRVFTSQTTGTRNASLAATVTPSKLHTALQQLHTWDFNVSVSTTFASYL